MPRLFVVEGALRPKRRGTSVWGYLDDPQNARVQSGDAVTIRKRDGAQTSTKIDGIPLGTTHGGLEILLDASVQELEVEKGDEIWVHMFEEQRS